MSDQSKVVVITGAAGGLGRALVQRFLSEEWFVFAASHRGDPVAARERFFAHLGRSYRANLK